MWHTSDGDDKFFAEMEEEDARVAARVQTARCQHCGGRLDRADYARKPRNDGSTPGWEGPRRRISLCCARDGCRRRATPPSLVFLGRRVYLGIAVLKASLKAAMAASGELNGTRVTPETGPPRRTVRRWLWWFRETLPRGRHFIAARAILWPPIEDAIAMPGALVVRFARGRTAAEALVATLRFLAPTTTASVEDGARFLMAVG